MGNQDSLTPYSIYDVHVLAQHIIAYHALTEIPPKRR